jgi:hypothetical protein
MRWSNAWLVAMICTLGLAVPCRPAVAADQAATQVQSAWQQLDRWLGENQNADQWRRFLEADQLQAQLEKGDQADRPVVQRILARYERDERGLHLWRFAAVRRALRAWLDKLPRLRREQLPEAARAGKSEYVPVTDQDVQQARMRLQNAVRSLEAFLSQAEPSEERLWKDYLRWDELQNQLVAEQEPSRRVLSEIANVFYQNETGLEMPVFTEVRRAIDQYADSLLFATDPRAEAFYQQNLEELATVLESHADGLPTEEGRKIGRAVGWLERFGQQRELVTAVREHVSQPNLYLQFSEQMLRSGVDRDVDEVAGIREVILGTSIRGTARMRGQVTLDLVPGRQPAAFDIVLTGITYSNNTGHNGPVTIRSSGVTSIDARKRLLLDEEGVGSRAAQAQARTRSTIQSISSHSHLVRKIAWKQAGRTKPRVEAIASQRAARRVEQNMNAQVAELLETLNDTFMDQFRKPLLRRDGFPQLLEFETTDDNLLVTMLQAGRDLLAAPTDPPPLTADHDIAVRFHETLVGNLSQAMLGGVTLDDERAAQLVEDLTGSVPEELQITDESDPWSIQFADQLPVQASIDDNNFTVSIRGTQFTRGETVVAKTMEISATYTVAKTPEGALLTRQGDVQVVYPTLRSEGIDEVAMKSFVKTKFEALMKPEIATDGLVLPDRWQNLGTLVLQQLHCDDGWAALGWEATPTEDRVAMRE